ncbi:bifunctional phosphoribosyl-AMP cyclohydrolase/phosphoribosyl-ATP diphosphatase HisIE [Alkalibacillus haloalkaliphilus]|uniref:bifunctional phosphoribosyl-AMP cyclohydrolase/phosphoribosyl-ATP diphosphatase HisIE n=1 Tax=Alkalibacillus haloalkaliphilus TaxID=94136 RepID=UPI002935AFC3|nr:bifunctional phosphoribosyl-AMP cyclohydrolase/phosphoribosyl-ATP diphosphatase HisIE [Alkalibacillus haloalkaliphilus]MDV2583407.1 bifunctional phosphoribosyl-AMP cyclohydrolase/phosphoribosyl-ATP diphosphatase HisIE [Alkalibacillus haloalkaliphilus]
MEQLEVQFDEKGLVPAIIQDYKTGEVLMLAYMNEESLNKTIESKRTWFYSRSRQELWQKGATSGNFQNVKQLSYDCDEDALLIQVEQVGAACHTGEKSCFYREVDLGESTPFNRSVINELYSAIEERKTNRKEGSYTNYLFDEGIDKILKKISEESGEILIGAKNDDDENLAMEIADLTYHLLVLMVEKGMSVEQVKEVLTKRMKGE